MAAIAASLTHAKAAGQMPTRKWWAATIVGVSGLLSTLVAGDWHWSKTASVALIALLTQRLVAYLVPNHDTAGGVPT